MRGDGGCEEIAARLPVPGGQQDLPTEDTEGRTESGGNE